MAEKVTGNDVLIFGDLHFSDVYTGRHRNYLENCFIELAKIEKKVNELRPCAVIFAGDLVGVNEGNINRREVLNMFCKWLRSLNSVCNVYSVRGNHDFRGAFPEFQFLNELGLIKTSADCDGGAIDFYGSANNEVPEIRYHLVDYGDESRELDICDGETTNIVVAHNNFTIQGLTNWYSDFNGLELSRQANFKDVFMVISGHIHTPSPQIVSTEMACGGVCSLFYVGCPTRPSYEKNLYGSCWMVRFTYDDTLGATNYSADVWELEPIEKTFITDDRFVEDLTVDEINEIERTERLKEVLDDIIKTRLTSGDLIGQVMCIPNASDEAKKMACDYLQMALDCKQVKG